MSWHLGAAVKGNLAEFLDEDVRLGEKAVTTVIRRKTTAIKNAMRRTIERALSKPLSNALRGESQPSRRGTYSFNARGLIFSKAGYKSRAGGGIDLLQVFEEGATITPIHGQWLAIPLHQARTSVGRGREHLKAPSEFPAGSLKLIPTNNPNRKLLVTKVKPPAQPVVMFILVREVRLSKRLDLERIYDRGVANLDEQIVRAWERGVEAEGLDELL